MKRDLQMQELDKHRDALEPCQRIDLETEIARGMSQKRFKLMLEKTLRENRPRR